MGKRIFKSILPMALGGIIILGFMVAGIITMINAVSEYNEVQIQKTWEYEEVYATVVRVESRKTGTTAPFPEGDTLAVIL